MYCEHLVEQFVACRITEQANVFVVVAHCHGIAERRVYDVKKRVARTGTTQCMCMMLGNANPGPTLESASSLRPGSFVLRVNNESDVLYPEELSHSVETGSFFSAVQGTIASSVVWCWLG